MYKYNSPTRPTAPDSMDAARKWLEKNSVSYVQLTDHHLKMGPVNFWPNKGTIVIDGEKTRRPEIGLSALRQLLAELGRLTPVSDNNRGI